MEHAHQDHLVEMLDDVHDEVKNRHFHKSQAGQKDVKIQLTHHDNRGFGKKLYFNPGIFFDKESGQNIVLEQGLGNTEGHSEASVGEPSTKKTKRNRDRRPHGDFSTSEK